MIAYVIIVRSFSATELEVGLGIGENRQVCRRYLVVPAQSSSVVEQHVNSQSQDFLFHSLRGRRKSIKPFVAVISFHQELERRYRTLLFCRLLE